MKAVVLTEVVEIKRKALEEILLSSNIELHKVIQSMSQELGKKIILNFQFRTMNFLNLLRKPRMLLDRCLFKYTIDYHKGFINENPKLGQTTKILMKEGDELFKQVMKVTQLI